MELSVIKLRRLNLMTARDARSVWHLYRKAGMPQWADQARALMRASIRANRQYKV